MESFSIQEVIEQAVQTERLGQQFYTTMQEKFKEHNGLRALFRTLANKESHHERTFRGLKEIVGDAEPEAWDAVVPYMRAVVESEFFLGRDKALPSMEHLTTVERAVDFAMRFEKETLLYFLGVRDVVTEKDVVDEIINEEKSHIMWLQTFRVALAR